MLGGRSDEAFHVRHGQLPLTTLVVALVVTLGGCGGSTTAVDDLPADAVFLTAVDRSTDVSTVRVQYETTARRAGEVLHTGGGEAVFAPGAASLIFTMGGFRGDDELAGEVSYELRFVDGTVYMRVPDPRPGLAAEDLPDAEWIVFADDDTDEMAAQLDQLDFGATLQALRDSVEVTEDGRETIVGVETTRYVGTTTLRSLLAAQGTPEEQFEAEAAGEAGADLDEPMPLTVWIDDDGLVRRYDYTMVDGDFETTQSMTVLEYGLEVDITAPPAELTMDAEEFDFESSEGTVTLDSEGSATAESAPAPTPKAATEQSTTDSDG